MAKGIPITFYKEKLKEGWSPEQISGRIKKEKMFEVTISHESIYDWIYETEKGKRYCKYLRRKQKKRIKRKSRKQKGSKAVLKERVSIHKRPEINKLGYWETDSMILYFICSIREKSMFCRISKCKDKSALESENAVRNSISSLPEFLWLSITRDNGTENALHHETKVQSYFCDPYSSWQKGGIENENGLIREYFPKKSKLNEITDLQIQEIEDKLNNRPRKKLNYLTPNEVITSAINKMGL
jgi:IS30 family transposase